MGVAGVVPVAAGLAGVLQGRDFLTGGGALAASGDEHVRYLSGLLLGIGLAFWGTIPAIERRGEIFRVLGGVILLGGLGRLYGFLMAPELAVDTVLPLVMELGVTPALILWRERVAGRVEG